MEIVLHQNTSGRAQTVVSLVPRRGDPVLWLIGAFVVIILVWGRRVTAAAVVHPLRGGAPLQRAHGRDQAGRDAFQPRFWAWRTGLDRHGGYQPSQDRGEVDPLSASPATVPSFWASR